MSSTNHTTNKKLTNYKNDVDVMAFYIPDIDTCVMFKIDEIGDKTNIFVRVEPPTNNQSNVTYVQDHTYDKYLKFSNL